MSPAPHTFARSAGAPVRSLVIVGDVHLTRADVGGALVGALARVVDDSAEHDLVFAGDLLDLPLDSSREHEDPERAIALIAADSRLRSALGRHVDRGNVVTLVAGNHDACIARASVIEALRDAIGLEGAARERLRATPWFARVGPVHIEHGHAHDPDNAPSHPLAEPLDGLGTFIVRNLIRPTGATAFLGQSDGTPMTQLWRAFRIYGVRGPGIVARYFATAFSALFLSGPRWRARANRLERGDLLAFARDVGLDAETIESLAALGAHPTFASIHRTFTRLYFDRVGLTVAAAVGAGVSLAGQPAIGLMTMTTASVLLAASIVGSPNRYAERAVEGLREAADRTADATGASLVVYGHVHREDAGERYANTSSFGCAPEARRGDGHPYLRVSIHDDRPRVERMLAGSCERMLAES